jgi:hypothetical protein
MGIFKDMHEQKMFASDWEYRELRRMLSEAVFRGYVEQIPVMKKQTRFSLPREWYRDKEPVKFTLYWRPRERFADHGIKSILRISSNPASQYSDSARHVNCRNISMVQVIGLLVEQHCQKAGEQECE